MSLQHLDKLRQEALGTAATLASQDALLEDAARLVAALVAEVRELRESSDAAVSQVYACQTELAMRDAQMEQLAAENTRLKAQVTTERMRGIVCDIADRAFLAAVDREFCNSLKMRSNGTSSFMDSLPRNAKLSIEAFKRCLMNSTKKKQKLGGAGLRPLGEAGGEGGSPTDEKTTLPDKARKQPSMDFEAYALGKKEVLRLVGKGKTDTFEAEFEKRPYEIFSEPKNDPASQGSRKHSAGVPFDPNDLFSGSNSSQKGAGRDETRHPPVPSAPAPRPFPGVTSPLTKPSQNPPKPPKESPFRVYSESEKILKEDLANPSPVPAPHDLTASNKEMTLKEMKFVSEPKTPHLRLRYFLRIKDEVPIELFDEFNRLKTHFSVVFMNQFNTQNNVFAQAKKEAGRPEHLCFVAFGAARAGKTYSILGNKDFPGLLPSFVSQIDYSLPVSVQMFEVKGDHVEDLIRLNTGSLEDSLGRPVRMGKLSAIPVASETALNKVFKVVITRRMKRERPDDSNLVIRLVLSASKSLTFVECCAANEHNAPDLQFIRLLGLRSPARLATSKNLMVRMLLQQAEPDARFCFVLLGHLASVANANELQRLVSFVDASL